VRLAVLALSVLAAGCAARGSGPARPDFGPVVDAPYQLDDDLDLAEQVDHMWGLAPRAPERAAERQRLAAAMIARAARHTDRGRWHLAHDTLLDVAALWQGDGAALGDGLAAHAGTLRQIAGTFRRAGADAEIVTALVLVHEADPAGRAAERAELDEVLSFLDELSTAQHGEVGRHARVVPALAPLVDKGGPPWLVDLYLARLADRQRLVNDVLTRDGASFELVAAHRDVLLTARTMARALARAGRAADIAAAVQELHGIGSDPKLNRLAAAVAAPAATARDWVLLARWFRDGDEGDPESALAVATSALVRFPDDATLLVAAADHASAVGRLQQPIRLYQAARARAPGDAEIGGRLTAVYRERLAQLTQGGRPLAARALLAQLEELYRELEGRFGAARWKKSRAEALSTVGRGLVSQGLLADATALLERSARLSPSTDAYEMLGTIALKRERWSEARRHLAAGLALPATAPQQRYARAKLLRLAGDAAAGDGESAAARKHWMAALAMWAALGDEIELPPELGGERLVESGRVLWDLGEPDQAVQLLETAVDVDAAGGNTHIQVVSFFILAGRFAEALDAYHRALGADAIGDFHKVYMSLWVLAEARRRGDPPDPLAVDYLESRDGTLWYDRLAELATGRTTLAALQPHATTRAQRAELAYYTAVLGLAHRGGQPPPDELRALFDAVIASDMVLFFEYDMARYWTRHGLAKRP